MSRRFGLIAIAALLGAGFAQWLAFRAQYRAIGALLAHGLLPCLRPVTYSVGSVDPRFGLEPAGLEAYLREAETVWEAAAGRDLFEALPAGGGVTVNLVYDRRQEALDKLKAIGLRTDNSLAAFHSLRDRYDELTGALDRRQQALAADLADYRVREAQFNAVVGAYNERGTATPAELRRLDARREALRREFSVIKSAENGVKYDIGLINALATTLNQLIVELQIGAEQYRREGAALGVYEEGLYRVDGGFRSIEIYKYTGRDQLVQLLAHEMGHALGMDHVEDGAALMYPLNRGGGLSISPADAGELARACARPFSRPWWRRLLPKR